MPSWLPYALASAAFAALTAILQKLGVAGVPASFATLVRTAVVLLLAGVVAAARSELRTPLNGRAMLFLVLSGLATGASWLCYARALQLGPAGKVAPVDKLSVVLVVLFAVLLLGETASWRVGLGAALIAGGVILVARG